MGFSRTVFTVIAVLLACCIVGSLASRHVVHEQRNALPARWSKKEKLDGRFVLPVRVGLAQQNLHRAEEYLMEVSDPYSPSFGQHWTARQVAETFAPTADTVAAVMEWLASAGIAPERISQSQSLNWLTFDATTDETERLLMATYYEYEHESGRKHVACDEYSIPHSIREHVDFVTPTIHFDLKIVGEQGRKMNSVFKSDQRTAANSYTPDTVSLPDLETNPRTLSLADCDTFITPACLRALYKFPHGDSKAKGNSYGIVEYTPNEFLQSDLGKFLKKFTSIPVRTAPIVHRIDGASETIVGESSVIEADLDLQYALAIVYPQTVTISQTGDFVEGASFNNFLDAIDGSYCTFEGGDNATEDVIYPDPFPGGYKGPENCGGFAANNVISTSYSEAEFGLSPFYAERQCQEYLKLGLQGVTILYSSGDDGVASGAGCIDPVTQKPTNGSSGLFTPTFPGTCPYVTSVGATQIKPGASVTDPEEACETVIFSGGGFSNIFPLPPYQAPAVKSWFKNHPPPYGADRFNNSQKTRGFPDVSANGAYYQVVLNGSVASVFGTSASSPVFGAIITLINEQRLKVGKSPVGFVNPTLYAHPGVLNDIKKGGNQGCGTPGFTSSKGWDPVTGLGTPNYPALLKLYLSLP